MGRIGRNGISVRSMIDGYSKSVRRFVRGMRQERGQKNIDCDSYAIPRPSDRYIAYKIKSLFYCIYSRYGYTDHRRCCCVKDENPFSQLSGPSICASGV
jgi:hypothetical protein